jgi:IS5 family transposase
MVALLYLKHAFNLSDEELVERWAENVVWQFFSGMAYYQPRLPCDATQIGRFRRLIGEAGVEQLLKTTVETALEIKAVKKAEFERVIVDSTVQEKAVAHPTDSRLLEAARAKIVRLAKQAGIALKQTHEREGKKLRRRASGYAHAKQFKRLARVLRRQRTVLGIVLREVRRKMSSLSQGAQAVLAPWMERAGRIHSQRRQDKGKLYALHAPEVECIGKGKARVRYEFGVKCSLAVTNARAAGGQFVLGARTVPGNPYDGHSLAGQIDQVEALTGRRVGRVYVDRGYRGHRLERAGLTVIISHTRGIVSPTIRREMQRRNAIEPVIGHLKSDGLLERNHLRGANGDAINVVLAAAGHNLRLLLAWLRLLCVLIVAAISAAFGSPQARPKPTYATA